MFELYAELRGVTVSEAKLELAAILCGGEDLLGTTPAIPAVEAKKSSHAVELST